MIAHSGVNMNPDMPRAKVNVFSIYNMSLGINEKGKKTGMRKRRKKR